MTDDVNARIATLLAGDADAAYIPRDKKTSVEGQPGIRIVAGLPTLNMDFLGLNQAINVTDANPELTNVPSDFFKDANVRKAFASAFNYDSFIQNSLNGYGIQPNSIIPQGLFGWSEDVPKYTVNLTKAAEYLRAAKVPGATSSSAGMLDEMSAAVFRWEI
jgi:peptide/nickel transport system substrate-binding protein